MIMRKIKLIVATIIISLSLATISYGQIDTSWTVRYDTITRRLRLLESSIPGLNEKVTNSVTGVSLNEFLRALAISSGVNISIDPGLNFLVINNFSNVKVSDILLFLCDQYKFNISSIGNIIVVKQIDKPVIPHKFDVQFDPKSNDLSVDVEDIELGTLSQKITDVTGKNVIPANGLFNQRINAYVQNMPIASSLDKIAYSNNLLLKSTQDGFFLFEKKIPEKTEAPSQKSDATTLSYKTEKEGTYKLSVNLLGKDSLSLFAEKAPISEILKEISFKSGNNFVMSSVPKGELSLQLAGAKFQGGTKSHIKWNGPCI